MTSMILSVQSSIKIHRYYIYISLDLNYGEIALKIWDSLRLEHNCTPRWRYSCGLTMSGSWCKMHGMKSAQLATEHPTSCVQGCHARECDE